MKLGHKSRVILDMILFSGLDALDFVTFPTRHLMRSGGWEESRSAKRHMKAMQSEGWIVWDDSRETGKWVLKITEAGKKALLGDIDPEARWSRPYDGKWRMIAFDLPASKQELRYRLLHWLKAKRFGRLQDSLWIAPEFENSWHGELEQLKFDPSGVSFFEGNSFAGSSDADFVEKSWDFAEINRRYSALLDFHRANRSGAMGSMPSSWVKQENLLWREAFKKDPFLPDSLLPRTYLGKKGLAARKQSFASLVGRED